MVFLEANCISRGDIANIKAPSIDSKTATCIDKDCPLRMSCPRDVRLEKKADSSPPHEIIFIARPAFN
ncbi:hypothetical protein M1271_00995 [Patescibacteria group bacterium]|nr:hypothetical protein [Patescibacteria group bacterium]MCL5798435.1 hypothetical protein [Patescibacteria group bacterium]